MYCAYIVHMHDYNYHVVMSCNVIPILLCNCFQSFSCLTIDHEVYIMPS